jgi:uncharacterized protein HemX
MSIYGPKSGPAPGPRPTATNQPLHWFGWLIAIVLGLGLGIYFIVEEERQSQQAELFERAGTIRRDVERSRERRESAEILFTVPDPPRLEKIEPLQSADIIH